MSKIWIRLCILALAGCAHESGQREPTPPRKEPTSAAKKTESAESPSPEPSSPKPPPAPAVASDHGLYDGSTGAVVSLSAFVESAVNADFIGFGELHRNAVGSRVQLQLLKALADQSRPVALAMEFFERDTQQFLDRYLGGEITEEQFTEWSGRKKSYATSHRPLIEFCKEHGIPVIAANTPNRLLKEYGRLTYSYSEYRDTLSDDELAYMPETTTELNEDEKSRFARFMGGHSGGRDLSSKMQSMALWDDTMAESAANFRAANPRHRVLLIVGMFHVMKKMGTVRKFTARRADDTVRTLIMVQSGDESVAFAQSDSGLADVVLKVRKPVPHGASK